MPMPAPTRMRPEDFKANTDYLAVPGFHPKNPWLQQQYAADVHAAAMKLGPPAKNPWLQQQRAQQANAARAMLMQRYGQAAAPTPTPTPTPAPPPMPDPMPEEEPQMMTSLVGVGGGDEPPYQAAARALLAMRYGAR